MGGILFVLSLGALTLGVIAGFRFDTASLWAEMQESGKEALRTDAVLVLTPLVGVLIAVALFAAQDPAKEARSAVSPLEMIAIAVGGVAFWEGVLACVGVAADHALRGHLVQVLALSATTFAGSIVATYWSNWRPEIRLRVAQGIQQRAVQVGERLGDAGLQARPHPAWTVYLVSTLVITFVATTIVALALHTSPPNAIALGLLLLVEVALANGTCILVLAAWFGATSRGWAWLDIAPLIVTIAPLVVIILALQWPVQSVFWTSAAVCVLVIALVFLPMTPRRIRWREVIRTRVRDQADRDKAWTGRQISQIVDGVVTKH